MIFETYIPKAERTDFLKDLAYYSKLLGIKPAWLMAVMYLESRINPKAKNPKSGAVGLIQFMPDTLKRMNITAAKMETLTARAQLAFVYKYLEPYKNKLSTFFDLYFAVFFPGAINQKSDFVLKSSKLSAALIANSNSGYDVNKDSSLTRSEVVDSIKNIIPSSAHFELWETDGKSKNYALPIIGIGILIGSYFIFKK